MFINEAFTKAIDDYLKSSDNIQGVTYNSFLVVVLRSLISIYSELDTLNPKVMNDEDLLKDNLSKFGYSKTDVEVFLSNLQLFFICTLNYLSISKTSLACKKLYETLKGFLEYGV